MTKPNFSSMTRKELLAYLLGHRDDDDVFYAYMDKAYAESAREVYPAPKSIDDLKHFPELLNNYHREREERS
ncbi:MAG: hypothetical protein HC866_24905 [Leptolyngbyaceae cyanobacterium RU_5_1]|nr:hypothetical protein [Leptolyngbyaceae cyanobacterium RU_5_1]